jgi:hypothetical protein
MDLESWGVETGEDLSLSPPSEMPAPLGYPVSAEFSGKGRESFEGKKRRGERLREWGDFGGDYKAERYSSSSTAIGHARMGTYFLSRALYFRLFSLFYRTTVSFIYSHAFATFSKPGAADLKERTVLINTTLLLWIMGTDTKIIGTCRI